MNTDFTERNSPLASVDSSFGNYLTRKKMMESKRIDGNGIPNYAYELDYESRRKLDAIPGFYETAKTITRPSVSREVHEYTRTSLAVGPNQFPEIYQIACECASTLGIAIPNVYIKNAQEVNACAYAVDDVEPTVIVNSGMLERFTLPELKYVIGHECGHLHNYHSAYRVLSSMVLGIGVAGVSAGISSVLGGLLSAGSMVLLNTWSRASEVTADRAGLLCADSLEDCHNAMAKLMYGGIIGSEHQIDFGDIRRQLDDTMESVARYSEIMSTHPATARRIAAISEFAECAVYYEWRPERKAPGAFMRSKQETDMRCNRYIDLREKR